MVVVITLYRSSLLTIMIRKISKGEDGREWVEFSGGESVRIRNKAMMM